MTEAASLAGDGKSSRQPDSLTIFSYVWAAQILVQLYFFRGWFDDGPVLGWTFAPLALAVFLFPGRVWLFGPMLVASIAFYISEWPFVVNHVFIDTFMAIAMCGALVFVLANLRTSAGRFDRSAAEAWFVRFAPVCGAIFAFMYFSIIVSKLNHGFFDLDISCITGMIEEADMLRRPLVHQLLSLFSVEFFFWFFIVAETALPFLLAFRRTRLLAFYFAVPFHILLGLMGHWPFSAFMLSLYVLVAMPSFRETVQWVCGQLDAWRSRFVPWAPAALLFAGANIALLASVVVLKPSWIWLLWSLALSAGLLATTFREHLKNGFFSSSGVIPFWTARPGVLWIMFVLAVLNSVSPYVGFKTESNVAMYSNMRTEGGVNNHLFLPNFALFGYQNDLVEIIDSNNEDILDLKDHPARYGYVDQQFDVYITYFELRRAVSRVEADDLEISYIRNGEPREYKRGAGDNVDESLDRPLPLALAKLLHFRPVFKGELSYCLH